MNQIIVAVDFSESSINSVEHAITIAQKAKTDILMVWVNNIASAKSLMDGEDKDIEGVVKHKFEELVAKFQIKLPKRKIEFAIRQGRVYREIDKIARENKASLILVGTHGTSGYDPFWIGSNANKLISIASCPIITIRLGIDVNKPLKKIVLPIDDTVETRQKLPITAEIAGYFDATVYILGLHPRTRDILKQVDNYSQQVAKRLNELKIKNEIVTLEAGNITKTTIDYARSIDANLISIMTEQTKTTKNLWLGPYAQQMVNQSPIPVLSIHPKEFLRTVAGL